MRSEGGQGSGEVRGQGWVIEKDPIQRPIIPLRGATKTLQANQQCNVIPVNSVVLRHEIDEQRIVEKEIKHVAVA